MMGHTDNICALCVCGNLIASAQDGKVPLVRIWNQKTGKCAAILKAHHSDIVCLGISDNGNTLAGVGMDKFGRQTIVLWDISNVLQSGKAPILIVQSVAYHISKIKFVPFEDAKFVTCGEDNIRFWRLKMGSLRGCSLSQTEDVNIDKLSFTDIAFDRAFVGNVSLGKNS